MTAPSEAVTALINEVWQEMKKPIDRARMRAAAVQVAAMALRFALDMVEPEGK